MPACLAEGDGVIAFRDLPFHGIKHFVLQENHRVVVANGGDQQSLGIGRRIGLHHFQSRNAGIPRGVILAVLGCHPGGGDVDHGHHAVFDLALPLPQPHPLLAALRAPGHTALLIDEIDRSDHEFEAFLLEFLSDFQISIPETVVWILANGPPVGAPGFGSQVSN